VIHFAPFFPPTKPEPSLGEPVLEDPLEAALAVLARNGLL
jgi:hypothetical protein